MPTMVIGVLLMVTTWLSTAETPRSGAASSRGSASRPDAPPGAVVIGREGAAERRCTPSTSKVLPETSSTSTRSACPRSLASRWAPNARDEAVEHVVAIAEVRDTSDRRTCGRSSVRPLKGPGPSSCTSCCGVLHRQQAQQHLVHQREDRGVGADAETEREDDDEREAGRAPERPERVTDVGDPRVGLNRNQTRRPARGWRVREIRGTTGVPLGDES